MSAATDCPTCPACGADVGSTRHPEARLASPLIFCCACGDTWTGTPEEHAQAARADAAYDAQCDAEIAAEMERVQARTERSLARQAFVDAGKPIPAWLEAMERGS